MHELRSTIRGNHDERRGAERAMGHGRLSPCCESWLVEQAMIEARMIRQRTPATPPPGRGEHPAPDAQRLGAA